MNTNKTIAFVFGVLCFGLGQLFAQTNIQGKVYYESKTTVDMSRFRNNDMPEEFKKRMEERMRKMNEKNYTLIFNQAESFYTEEEQKEESGRRWGPPMMSEIVKGPQYRNVKEGLMLQEQELVGKKFLITDSLPSLDWKMSGETKQIGDYMCFKATATKTVPNFEGRRFGPPRDSQDGNEEKTGDKPLTKDIEIEAWYTLQIPINQGPGDYWGLPGLILEVVADNTTIVCSKIEINPDVKNEIIKPSKGKKVTQKAYNAILRKKMEEIRAQNNSGDNRMGPPPGGF
ncbi:MAG: GLPGLI family protein [Flavobacteriaceae bacterium]